MLYDQLGKALKIMLLSVLILILMEYALWGSWSRGKAGGAVVPILILMEYAIWVATLVSNPVAAQS